MRRSAAPSLLASALAWGALAASPALAASCPTGATGRWIVKAWDAPPVTDATQADVDSAMGRRVLITDKLVIFPGMRRCPVSRIERHVVQRDPELDRWEGPEKWPGFSTVYYYICANDVTVPNFRTGPSCDVILADEEGLTFRLVREPRRLPHGPR